MTTRIADLLGTVTDLQVLGVSGRQASKIERSMIDEVRRLEAVFSIFDPASDINRLRSDGRTDVPELIEVLALARRWQPVTAGAFSPHIDELRSVWIEAERTQQLPIRSTLRSIAERAGIDDSTASLNLNALAKGWIVDRSIDTAFARQRAPSSCWVSIGGDVAHRGDGSVAVGIEDPFEPFDNVDPSRVVRLSNQALATSGASRRFFTIDGERFSHVIDPRSGWPVDHIVSATVIAADAATADVLATAATVLQPRESIDLIESIEDAACLIVDATRATYTSKRWPPA